MKMPASGGDPIGTTLRLAFSPASKAELDSGIEASAKRVLLSRIDFEPATNYQASVLNQLKSKYIVINTKVTPSDNGNTLNGGSGNCKKSASSNVSLPVPKLHLFPPERIQLGYRGNVAVGSGMLNMGNTCYLNSTLQALFHVPALVNWLLSEPTHQKCEQNSDYQMHPDDITCSVIKTFKCSQQKTGGVMKPTSVYSKLRAICKHLSHGSQEDAHEFMRYLLESLEKSYLTRFQGNKLDSASKETTPINQIFGGYIRTEVTCLTCGAVSTTFQHFQDLPLDIRKASTLNDALAGYFERERLPDGEDAYKCEKCNRKVSATKKFSIEKPPNVLCVQLKRFSAANGKITKQVQLPECLDVTRFISPSVQPRHPVTYKLVSMVTHMGQSANCGHYTAIASVQGGRYYQFDDSSVRPIPTCNVLSMGAYLVLYEIEKPFATVNSPRTFSAPSTVLKRENASCKEYVDPWTENEPVNTFSVNNNNNINNHNHNNNNENFSVNNRNKNMNKINNNNSVNNKNNINNSSSSSSSSSSNGNRHYNSSKNSSTSNGNSNTSDRTLLDREIREGSESGSRTVNQLKHGKTYTPPESPKREPPSSNRLEVVTAKNQNGKRSSLVPYESDVSTDSDLENKDQSELEKLLTKSPAKGWEVTTDQGDSPKEEPKDWTTSWSVTEVSTPKKLVRNLSDTEVNGKKKRKIKTSGSDSELEKTYSGTKTGANKKARNSILERYKTNFGKREEKSGPEEWQSNKDSSKPVEKKFFGNEERKEENSNGKISQFGRPSHSVENGSPATEGGNDETKSLGASSTEKSNARRNGFNGESACLVAADDDEEGDKKAVCNAVERSFERKKEIINGLLQNSHRGYGSSAVKTWNGSRTSVEREIEEEKRESGKRTHDDLYNEEFDKGKVKKMKINDYNMERERPRYNPFQERANQQQSHNNHHHHHYRSNNNSSQRYRHDYRNPYKQKTFNSAYHKNNTWNYRRKRQNFMNYKYYNNNYRH